jgi:hypothetical protein
MDSLRSDTVSLSETCLRPSVDGSEALGIKVKETTDMNKEGHPDAITFPTIKTEPEVKEEEHPEAITFPTVKTEPEVCFVSV